MSGLIISNYFVGIFSEEMKAFYTIIKLVWEFFLVLLVYIGGGALLLFLIAGIGVFFGSDIWMRRYKITDNDYISRITGVPFPEFSSIYYYEGRTSFNGDYTDDRDIMFDEMPSDEFYHILDSLSSSENTYWSKDGEEYGFGRMWGNGYPAPPGESEDDDRFLYIQLSKKDRFATIRYGRW